MADPQTDRDDEDLASIGDRPVLPPRRGSELVAGLQLLPEQRLKAFSPEQLEIVTEIWVREKVTTRYERVLRSGGTGDKGRDVVAYPSAADRSVWDNYQTKRYGKALAPSDIWPEICKLVYWAVKGAYTNPRRYTFVAPLGVGAKAAELLEFEPDELRRQLLEQWETHGVRLCPLDEIKETITQFDFPEFDAVRPGEIVNDLKGTREYPVLFGGGLSKPRPPDAQPPDEIVESELLYIDSLVEAYDDHCPEGVAGPDAAFSHEVYGTHLRGSRREFYCAESLREFSKDVLAPPDDFDGLQEQIADGIKYTVARDFPTGYDRVLAACEQATVVEVADHPLRGDLRPSDRSGMCHQLANDGKVKWKRP